MFASYIMFSFYALHFYLKSVVVTVLKAESWLFFTQSQGHINHKGKGKLCKWEIQIFPIFIVTLDGPSWRMLVHFIVKSVNILIYFSGSINLWHDFSVLESVAELRVPVLQAALTTHNIDADSAMGVSIITDDKSSCRFSDDEEVSECVYEQSTNYISLIKQA